MSKYKTKNLTMNQHSGQDAHSISSLLYLMVLTDSRTISKSINSYDKTDDVFDAITDLYYTTNHKLKHNRHVHKHRRVDKNDVTKPFHSRNHARQHHGNPKILDRDVEIETKHPDKTYPMLTTIKVPQTATEHSKHKSPNTRAGSFWRKFRNKLRTTKQNEINRHKRTLKYVEFKQYHYNHGRRRRDNNNEYVLERPKHSDTRDASKSTSSSFKKWLYDEKNLKKTTTKMKTESRPRYESLKERQTTPTYVNLTAELDAITTEILHLKELYAVDQHLSTTAKSPFFQYTEPRTSTIYESEFPGTAQIEELLNDIKAKAIEMIAQQSPSITDLISSTVTEATFGADPILVHSELGGTGYAFSTFVSINAINDEFNKRDAYTTSPYEYKTENLIKNTEPHGVYRRSIQGDAMTLAQSVEYMLQKKLKKVIHHVKDKVSGELQKGINKIKHRPGHGKTVSMKHETKTPITKKITESTGYKNNKDNKHKKNKAQATPRTYATMPVSTVDDYVMLSLYEQILSKTRDDNSLKMVTGKDTPLKIRKRDLDLLSKRNFETLTDLKLKEDVQKLYDDTVNMPEYDYNLNSINSEDSTEKTTTSSSKTISTDDQLYDEAKTNANIEETSFEELSSKIAYNDFVNGYKHYLNFQKEQANSNFSNMVKYQAHRHHNVDDIGKFILNKIPHLPSRYKRFFDDTDIEDQEVTTKSDDSWFKKHFYVFLDNGPPKKFHTSETVPLKYPMKPSDDKSYVENKKRSGEDDSFIQSVPNEVDETTQLERNSDMNLEELSMNLEGNKRQGSHIFPLIRPSSNQLIAADDNTTQKIFAPRNIIGKIFGGKKEQTLKHDINGNSKPIKQLNETGRLRRGSKDSTIDYDNANFKNNVIKLSDTAALHGDNSKQHGYININVVPQPTAIVKLRDSSKKKSKVKNFFKKFRFHKDPKTTKKLERNLKRRRRFSPIKKLKSMFSVRTDNKPMPPSFSMEDDEMAYSHVDGFKPIKYDKAMSVQDMKEQIPNITDILDNGFLEPTATAAETGKLTSDMKWVEDHEFLNNQLSNFGEKYNEPTETTYSLVPEVKYTTPSIKKSAAKSYRVNTIPFTTNFRMDVKINKIKPTTERIINTSKNQPLQLMTLEDMRNEIQNIQSKLFHARKLRPYASMKSTSVATTPIINIKSIINPEVKNHGLVSRGNHKSTLNRNIVNSKTTLFSSRRNNKYASKKPTVASLTAKPTDEDMIIEGKLTRVAKFPIWHHNHGAFVQSFDDFSENYVNVEEPVMYYKKENIDTDKNRATAPQKSISPLITVSVTQDSPYKQSKVDYKMTSDYFGDLLLWNDDILNSYGVTDPAWQPIIDSMDENVYTTPNLVDLASELNEINKFLITADGARSTANNHQIRNTYGADNVGIIKSLAINDKALVESDDVVIKGEAKYFKYNNPVTDSIVKVTVFGDKDFSRYKGDSGNEFNIIDDKTKLVQTDPPYILVDTTLLVYDDEIDYINDKGSRKMSRNSTKSATDLTNSSPNDPVVAKTNKQPKQYYTTPLPMKSNEFDRFLKQNSLDVESVTSPLSLLPSYVDTWSHKRPEITSNSKTNEGMEIMKDTEKNENITPKLFMMEPVIKSKSTTTLPELLDRKSYPELGLDENMDERLKRYSEIDSPHLPYRKDTKQNKYYDTIKKKMKLIENKHTRATDSTLYNDFNDLDIRTDKEVEITIINFDDNNKTPVDNSELDVSWNTLKSTRNIPLVPGSISVGDTEPIVGKPLMHNNLLYNDKHNKPITPKVVVVSIDSNETEYLVPITVDFSMDHTKKSDLKAHDFMKYLNNFKSMHEPKSVHISGNSYEYDIIYGHDKVTNNTLRNAGKYGRDLVITTTTKSLASQEPQIIILPEIDNNSQKVGVRKMKRNNIFEKINRRAREVETFKAAVIPVSGSVVYDLKDIDSSTRSVPTKERDKRLFKLLPLLQDKLKSIRKHSSETAMRDSVEEPTTLETTAIPEGTTTDKTGKNGKSKDSHEGKGAKRIDSTDSGKRDNEPDYDEQRHQPEYSEPKASVTPDKYTEQFNNVTPKLDKRDVRSQEKYTAKDVAALEIIVDLMKNTLNYEERGAQSMSNRMFITNAMSSRDPMNSLEVHIAIPYDLQNSNKRSLEFEPMRIRKVFSAKMSSPVDMEYQVHSYEGLETFTTESNDKTETLAPGLYLLVNNSLSKNGYILKPVPGTINVVKSKELPAISTVVNKVEATTVRDGRVTLSKEFIAAVSKQIIELFQNVTIVPVRQPRQVNTWKTKEVDEHKSNSSSLWNAIKKYFGHDRVCNCKCKPYKAMCDVCAASDAVMRELIFEFDNLSKYMTDHCTEIQTFFWMNPNGGKKLRDSVHKIDTSMRDYFKRVKGKCQGRPCKTFSTFIDKRNLKSIGPVVKDVGVTFVNDVESLAEDVDKVTKVVTCFNQKLKDRSDRMIHAIGNCLNVKLFSKRSDFNSTKKKLIKNVYSLDNINVNIICKPEMSTTTENNYVDVDNLQTLQSTLTANNILNALEKRLNEKKNKKEKGIKKFFTKKKKLFTYYVTKDATKLMEKRDVTQIEVPLISDSGGTFWYDYIKGKKSEPRIIGKPIKKLEPQVGITVIQTRNELSTHEQSVANKMNNIFLTVRTSPKMVVEREVTTPDLPSYNVNQLLKLFETVNVDKNKEVNSPTPNTTAKHDTTKTYKHSKSTKPCKTKRPKKKKCSKASKKVKDKLHTTATNVTTTEHTDTMQTIPSLSFTKTTTKQTGKSILYKLIENLTKVNFLIDEEKYQTSEIDNRKRFTHMSLDDYDFKTTKDTADQNPTIMIINDFSINEKKGFYDYKNLLLSIIQHETNKLNNEWIDFAYKDRRESDKTKETEKNDNLNMSTKATMPDKNTEVDYSILDSLEVEPPEPEPKAKHKSKNLLNKIANKIGIKALPVIKEMKAGKKKQFDIMTRSAANASTATGAEGGLQARQETGDSAHQICNIQATYDHIRNLYDILQTNKFENYVRNITCYKYKRVKRFYLIEYPSKEKRRFDWIRRKRSLRHTFYKNTKNTVHVNVVNDLNRFNDDEFVKYVIDDDGIYRIRNREKRTVADLKDLDVEMRNMAPLNPAPNELYTMLGDTITIDCTSSNSAHAKYAWKSESKDMLHHDNVLVDGPKITIRNVGSRNDGRYTCSENERKLSDIRVSVVTPPEYAVVFTPIYSTKSCSNQDLQAIQLLGPEISKDLSCGGHCSVRIDEPICQKNMASNTCHIKTTAVLTVKPDPSVQCGVQCRRDLQSSLALLVASNVPQIAKVGVIVSHDGRNKTLLPSRYNQNYIVTHKLKKKDSNGHHEYHGLASKLSPGEVDVVLACPAGFYLIQEKKICAPCPANTSSSRGDNVCCARAGRPRHSTPGLLRRYDWWWYPPCGYVVACGGVVCACGVCAALALLGHVTSRGARAPAAAGPGDDGNTASKRPSILSAFARSPRAHPLSPSRVILARFFRPSLTSSKATDSQETKFELWKEKNIPPPLPPIDFDL